MALGVGRKLDENCFFFISKIHNREKTSHSKNKKVKII